jgi:hypothetical protein
MKHEAINVESAEAFKDSIMDLIDYTPAMVADELKKALHIAGVDEGVKGSIHCFSQIAPGGVPMAYCIVDVCPAAMVEWTERIARCVFILENNKFHVEQTLRPCVHRELSQYTISVRYERPRPV